MIQDNEQSVGVSPDGAGLSSFGPSPTVSAVPVSIPDAKQFLRDQISERITEMLDELGHPPLVERIYPKGWQGEPLEGLINLYDLCRRTFIQRERRNG